MHVHFPFYPTDLSGAILQTVAYADVFDYPLTSREIHRYLIHGRYSLEEVEAGLLNSILSRTAGGTYTLPGREMLATKRRQREEYSAHLWPRAIFLGRLIARLPFVRMVAVTGALAMNNVDQGGDVDYLIVTVPGRLWLCRALVLLIGRLAALDGVTVCPNYLVSLDTLDFPDRNLYAAHEIAQMVPLAGLDVYERIRKQNDWVMRFLPNSIGAPAAPWFPARGVPSALARPLLESLLQTGPVTSLEHWEMNRKIRKLRLEQGSSPESDFSADICKGHLHHHGMRTEVAFEERLRRLAGEAIS